MTEKRLDISIGAEDKASATFQKVGQSFEHMQKKLKGGWGGADRSGEYLKRLQADAKRQQDAMLSGGDTGTGGGGGGFGIIGKGFAYIAGADLALRKAAETIKRINELQNDASRSGEGWWANVASGIAQTVPGLKHVYDMLDNQINGAIKRQIELNEKNNALLLKRAEIMRDINKLKVDESITRMMQGFDDAGALFGLDARNRGSEQIRIERDRNLREIEERERQAREKHQTLANAAGLLGFSAGEFDRSQYEAARIRTWEVAAAKLKEHEDAAYAAARKARDDDRAEEAKQLAEKQKERDRAHADAIRAQYERNDQFLQADSELYEQQMKLQGDHLEAQREAIRRSFDDRLAGAKTAQEYALLDAQMRLALSQVGKDSGQNRIRGGVDLGPALGNRFSGLAASHDPHLAATLKVSDHARETAEQIRLLREDMRRNFQNNNARPIVIQ